MTTTPNLVRQMLCLQWPQVWLLAPLVRQGSRQYVPEADERRIWETLEMKGYVKIREELIPGARGGVQWDIRPTESGTRAVKALEMAQRVLGAEDGGNG